MDAEICVEQAVAGIGSQSQEILADSRFGRNSTGTDGCEIGMRAMPWYFNRMRSPGL